jgi:2-keto-3-deoxy-L-rhamnonate aldolase RhmA
MRTLSNAARERLERGELALGVGIRFARSVEIAKVMKSAGYDWLFLDLEHSTMSLDTASQISVAALDVGIAPIARVPSGDYASATRLLDNGMLGIVIPHVNTADEAKLIVEKLKFPPQGHRSISSSVPQFDYASLPVAELTETLNRASLVIVMLETPEAIENADEIAAVPGVDVLLMGTNDLCAEMGIHGDFGNPRVEEAYRQMIAACRKHGKWAGLGGVYEEPLMRRYIEMGTTLVLCGADLSFMLGAAKGRATVLRGLGR